MRNLRVVYRALMMAFGAGSLVFWMYQIVTKLVQTDLVAKIGACLPYFS